MNRKSTVFAVLIQALCPITSVRAAGPDYVDMTWLSIANMYFELGSVHVLTDGYITRLPQNLFYGGGGGLGSTRQAFKSDIDSVKRVLDALGGPEKLDLLLSGHSHFDHSFDTASWSQLTGASIVGPISTCFQVMAESIPADRCQAVYGGERISLAEGISIRVVRWNHSGNSADNPEQHDPVELGGVPVPDPQTGGLRGGVAEDFPNGGGSRAFLFVVDSSAGRYSWFLQNSASAADLDVPIIVDGTNYGAPIENLRSALEAEELDSVDLWIGTGGLPVAELVQPVLQAKAYLPIHWDGLWGAFEAGVTRPYSDPALEAYLERSGVNLIRPVQYMDKWRLDARGIQPVPNPAVKQTLGFVGD